MRPATFFTSLGFTEATSTRTTAVLASACGSGLSAGCSRGEPPNFLNSITCRTLLDRVEVRTTHAEHTLAKGVVKALRRRREDAAVQNNSSAFAVESAKITLRQQEPVSKMISRRGLLKSSGITMGTGLLASRATLASAVAPSASQSVMRLSLNENAFGPSPQVILRFSVSSPG
jgi:hypothetical protein